MIMRLLVAIFLGMIGTTLSSAAYAQVQRVVINPSFETPAISLACQGYVYAARVPGWQTTDAPLPSPTADFDSPNGCVGNNGTNPAGGTRVFEFYSNNVVDNQTSLTLMAANGNNFVELNAQTASRLYQNMCMIPGETVNFSFNHLGRTSATVADVASFRLGGTAVLGSGTEIIRASDSNDGNPGSVTAGLSTNTVRTTGPSAGGTGRNWGTYTGSFVVPAGNGGIQELAFEAVSAAGGNTARGNFLDNVTINLKPVIEFNSATYSSIESNGTPPQIQFRVAGIVPSGGTPVSITITSGTATLGTDYTINSQTSATFTFTIPAGDYGTGTLVATGIPVSIINDILVEGNENFVASINDNAAQYLMRSTSTCNGAGQRTSTYTIQDNDGTIRIVKDAQPNHAQDFAFTTSFAGLPAFNLDDDSDATLSNTQVFTADTGTYSVTETALSGWSLGSLTCTDPDNGTTTALATRTASIDLDIGETIQCTFVNIQIVPLTMVKSSIPLSDPINGTSNPKLLPGGVVRYIISISNPGTTAIDANSVVLIDPTPASLDFRALDAGGAGSGPVIFTPGTSGLTYTYTSLNSTTDNVDFSNDGGLTWNATPVPGTNGTDPTITHIRIRPQGTMAPGSSITFAFNYAIE